MADDGTPKPDNVIQFRTTQEPDPTQVADLILQEAMGDFAEVIVIGLAEDGYMTVTSSERDVGGVYEMLMSAAMNVAMAAIDQAFGTEH